MQTVVLRLDPAMWANEEIRDRLVEQMRSDLAVKFYEAGERPTGTESLQQQLGKVVMVDGQPTHEDADETDADHIILTLSRPSSAK